MTVKKNQRAFTLSHFKLLIRGALLLWAITIEAFSQDLLQQDVFMSIVWLVMAIDVILKLFPLKYESMGSQKQFAKNYAPVKDVVKAKVASGKRVLIVALLWIILNAVIAHLYFKNVIDAGIMVIISLFYSVCDMICILFYCPFQHILGNKCCNTCRIYNWDYLMMFTPLMFIGNGVATMLVILSVVVLVRWEYTVWRYPQRFCESTNANLKCANCKETRCTNKGMKRT